MVKHELAGQVFGRLTVIAEAGRSNRRQVLWSCRCECGKTVVKVSSDMLAGHTRSCGCLQRELLGNRRRTHQQCGTKTYQSWFAMLQRCTNEKNRDYPDYGGRGIKVCDRWRKFENFLADMGERPAGTTLDREDNLGPYAKSNCRWATDKEQARNKRTSRLITWQGETLCVAEWAERLGIPAGRLRDRIKMGWPVDRMMTAKPWARG